MEIMEWSPKSMKDKDMEFWIYNKRIRAYGLKSMKDKDVDCYIYNKIFRA